MFGNIMKHSQKCTHLRQSWPTKFGIIQFYWSWEVTCKCRLDNHLLDRQRCCYKSNCHWKLFWLLFYGDLALSKLLEAGLWINCLPSFWSLSDLYWMIHCTFIQFVCPEKMLFVFFRFKYFDRIMIVCSYYDFMIYHVVSQIASVTNTNTTAIKKHFFWQNKSWS